MDAFFAFASDDGLTMHVTYDGTTDIVADDGSMSEEVHITGEMDAAGEDFAGTVLVEAGAQVVDAEVVRVNGTSYVRPAGGTWQQVNDDGSQPVNPFAALEGPEELEYVGEATWQGQPVHQLRTDKWLGDDPASMESDTVIDAELGDHSFDIFVTDEGVPVGGELTADIAATVSGTPATITNSFTYEFADVGEPVTIEAPTPGT